MNSSLQCLSNTKELTDYIIQRHFINDINIRNPLGTKGKLVKAYAELINKLWHGASLSQAPWDFKKTLSLFASQFVGY